MGVGGVEARRRCDELRELSVVGVAEQIPVCGVDVKTESVE